MYLNNLHSRCMSNEGHKVYVILMFTFEKYIKRKKKRKRKEDIECMKHFFNILKVKK